MTRCSHSMIHLDSIDKLTSSGREKKSRGVVVVGEDHEGRK